MKTWQVLYIFLFSICFYVKGINVTLNITGGTIYLYMYFLLLGINEIKDERPNTSQILEQTY